MVRFIHAADIHLDSPMRHLERYEGAPVDEIRGSTRRAFTNLIDLAIAQAVDFVIIAGDLYDGDWKDHNTGLFFAREVNRLRSADIPLYFISGNHDAANKLTKALPLPANPDGSPMMLSSTKVQSVQLADHGIVLHGRGFKEQAETENIAEKYPKAIRDMRNVGILHTSLQGSPGHAPYAPCTPQQLADKEYAYWALGHIHIRGDRRVEGSCPIVYSGNTQGRNVRECGAKGCYVVEIDQNDEATMRFEPLDVCRWEICEIEGASIRQPDDLASAFHAQVKQFAKQHGDIPLIVRARVSGVSPLHHHLLSEIEHLQSTLRSVTFEFSETSVWLERLRVDTTTDASGLHATGDEFGETSPGGSHSSDSSNPRTELAGMIQTIACDQAAMGAIMHGLDSLRKKLPPELTDGDGGFRWDEADGLQNVIAEAESLLSHRLVNSRLSANAHSADAKGQPAAEPAISEAAK